MNTIDQKKDMFKKLVVEWSTFTSSLYNTKELFDVIELEGEDNEDWLEGVDSLYRAAYFDKLKVLFEIPYDSEVLYAHEWFWLEWEPTDSCFYYIYGTTALERETKSIEERIK